MFFFGSVGEPSPYWQAIAREFVERWVHHSQIRRALGRGSLAEERYVSAGADVVAAAAGAEATEHEGQWSIGTVLIGSTQQTADVLTRGHTADEIRELVTGPGEDVERAVLAFGR